MCPRKRGNSRLTAEADGYLLRMSAGETEELPKMEADVSRLRLAVEGSADVGLVARRVLSPSLEVGVRYDGGDAETGIGLELGGGLRYTDAEVGLALAAMGRVLLAHADREFREWGASASLSLDPGAPGRGAALSVNSSYGTAASDLQRLWTLADADLPPDASGAAASAGRVAVQLGYGLETSAGGGVHPYVGVELTDADSATWRVGSRFDLHGFDMEVEGNSDYILKLSVFL